MITRLSTVLRCNTHGLLNTFSSSNIGFTRKFSTAIKDDTTVKPIIISPDKITKSYDPTLGSGYYEIPTYDFAVNQFRYVYASQTLPAQEPQSTVKRALDFLRQRKPLESMSTFLSVKRDIRTEDYRVFSKILLSLDKEQAVEFFFGAKENDKKSFIYYLLSSTFINGITTIHQKDPELVDELVKIGLKAFTNDDKTRVKYVLNVRSFYANVGRVRDSYFFELGNHNITPSSAKNILISMIEYKKFDREILLNLKKDLYNHVKFPIAIYPILQLALENGVEQKDFNELLNLLGNLCTFSEQYVGRLLFYNYNNKQYFDMIIEGLIKVDINPTQSKFRVMVNSAIQTFLKGNQHNLALRFLTDILQKFNTIISFQMVHSFATISQSPTLEGLLYWTWKQNQSKKPSYETPIVSPLQVYEEINPVLGKEIPKTFEDENSDFYKQSLETLYNYSIKKDLVLKEPIPTHLLGIVLDNKFISNILESNPNLEEAYQDIFKFANQFKLTSPDFYNAFKDNLFNYILTSLFQERYIEDALTLAIAMAEQGKTFTKASAVNVANIFFDLSIPIYAKENVHHNIFLKLSKEFPEVFKAHILKGRIENSNDDPKELNEILRSIDGKLQGYRENIKLRFDILTRLYPDANETNLKKWLVVPDYYLNSEDLSKIQSCNYLLILKYLIKNNNLELCLNYEAFPLDFLKVVCNDYINLLWKFIPHRSVGTKYEFIEKVYKSKQRHFHPTIVEYLQDNIPSNSLTRNFRKIEEKGKGDPRKRFNKLSINILENIKGVGYLE